jgi:hypothetical protein
MSWKLNSSVVRGEIDNRIKNTVFLRFVLVGQQEFHELRLEGNCRPDLAGALTTFENPAPSLGDEETDLEFEQTGIAGTMTVLWPKRFVAVPAQGETETHGRRTTPAPPRAKALYLEWHSAGNGRVIIESNAYQVTVSDRAWRMTKKEAELRYEVNRNMMEAWSLGSPFSDEEDDEKEDVPYERTWIQQGTARDEFGWEKMLQKEDNEEKLALEREKLYACLPLNERQRMHDRWSARFDIEAYLEKKENEEVFGAHRLYRESLNLFLNLCGAPARDGRLPGRNTLRMQLAWHRLNTQLADALNGFDSSQPPQPGFVVAQLKRGLKSCNQVLAHLERTRNERSLPSFRRRQYRDDLFGLREAILRLMNEYRDKVKIDT